MANLVCSMVYTPSIKTNNNVKYVCSDSKIHIRFKDFIDSQTIEGFERKLTYLICYLFHAENYSTIEEFVNSKNFISLQTELSLLVFQYTGDKCKGIKLLKNYNKKDVTNIYGEINPECFPIHSEIQSDSLSLFLATFNINLAEYLFNDAYKIIISKEKQESDNKFIRKKQKRESLEKDSLLYKLW